MGDHSDTLCAYASLSPERLFLLTHPVNTHGSLAVGKHVSGAGTLEPGLQELGGGGEAVGTGRAARDLSPFLSLPKSHTTGPGECGEQERRMQRMRSTTIHTKPPALNVYTCERLWASRSVVQENLRELLKSKRKTSPRYLKCSHSSGGFLPFV